MRKFILMTICLLAVSPVMAQATDVCQMIMSFSSDTASTLYGEADYQTAVDLLTEELDNDADNTQAYLQRACHYEQLGDFESAYADMLTYIYITEVEPRSTNRQLTKDNTLSTTSTVPESTETTTVESGEFGGTITVNFPEGWVAEGDNGAVLIANSEEVMAIEDPTSVDEIPQGSVLISLSIIPGDIIEVLGLTPDSSPAEVIELFSSFMGGDSMPEFGETEEFEVDDNEAARSTGSDATISATLYAVEKDGNFTFGFGATRPDEVDQFADTIQAIIASATFTATE